MNTVDEIIRIVNGLLTQADNVERDGHLNAACHMRDAAELLEVVVHNLKKLESKGNA